MGVEPSKLEGSPLPFLHLMEVLKHLPRTGELRTIKNPESVAAYRYRLLLLAMFAPVRLTFLSKSCSLTCSRMVWIWEGVYF